MHNLSIIFAPADINRSSPGDALLNYMLNGLEDSHISPMEAFLNGMFRKFLLTVMLSYVILSQ